MSKNVSNETSSSSNRKGKKLKVLKKEKENGWKNFFFFFCLDSKEKRFSIHDAFEEETDEAIRVYGSTVISTPLRAKTRSTDDVTIRVHDPR